MRRARAFLVVCATGLVTIGTASADGDVLDVRALATGEAIRASAYGSAAWSQNPAGLALNKAYVIEGSYGFRPDDDGQVFSASVCDSTPPRVSGCLFYGYESAAPTLAGGEGEETLHMAGMTLAMPFGDKLYIGTTTRYIDYTEKGASAMPSDGSRDGAFLVDGGLVTRLGQNFSAALVGYNLVGADEDRFARAIGGGVSFIPIPALVLGADMRYSTVTEASRYSVGAEYMLGGGAKGYPLRAGFLHDEATDTNFISGGLGYWTPRVAIDVAGRKDLSEGGGVQIQFGLRVFLPN